MYSTYTARLPYLQYLLVRVINTIQQRRWAGGIEARTKSVIHIPVKRSSQLICARSLGEISLLPASPPQVANVESFHKPTVVGLPSATEVVSMAAHEPLPVEEYEYDRFIMSCIMREWG